MQEHCRSTRLRENESHENISDHQITSLQSFRPQPDLTPKTDDHKIALIAEKFRDIMEILGLDLEDDSLKGTPQRVAKMFVNELFPGLNPDNRPQVALFENKFNYTEMLTEFDIPVYSVCEHHFLPIIGKAHVAYIPGQHVIGLSKISRLVEYVSRRPQIQERLTVDIANELKTATGSDNVAVVVEAHHLCVAMRGVNNRNSCTTTASFSGTFQSGTHREAFLKLLPPKSQHSIQCSSPE